MLKKHTMYKTNVLWCTLFSFPPDCGGARVFPLPTGHILLWVGGMDIIFVWVVLFCVCVREEKKHRTFQPLLNKVLNKCNL
jgi:hypothetical protein